MTHIGVFSDAKRCTCGMRRGEWDLLIQHVLSNMGSVDCLGIGVKYDLQIEKTRMWISQASSEHRVEIAMDKESPSVAVRIGPNPPSDPFQVVVSAENNQYMAWQTQLFCFSALTRLGKHPIIVVHDTGLPLRKEFILLQRCGFRLIQAPSFNTLHGQRYPPRNEIGSLLTFASSPLAGRESILFCEPDMLFVGPYPLGDTVSGEFYRYIQYEDKHIVRAARKIGLADAIKDLNTTSKIGVPYALPGRDLVRIASRWVEVLDAFEIPQWIDIMYAFGFALRLEGIEPRTMRLMNDNLNQRRQLTGRMIHYCYGDSTWSKRSFVEKNPLAQWDWSLPRAKAGTILQEISTQIRQAKNFYHYRGLFKRMPYGPGYDRAF